MNIFDSLGMGGLIKANLKVYFDSIKHGINHRDALTVVLKSRYPFEAGKSREVALRWEGARMAEAHLDKTKPPAEKDELRDLIHTMYSVETHLDRADVFKRIKENEKFDAKFNELYDSMKTKYKVKDGVGCQ